MARVVDRVGARGRRRPRRDGHGRGARRDARPLGGPRAGGDRRGGVLVDAGARRPTASGRPATSASTTRSLHGRRLRIEHWEVARAQGKRRRRGGRGPAGRLRRGAVLLVATSADWATLEYVGPASEWDREVVRGSIDDGEFAIFYLSGDRLVAALTVGRPEDLMAARADAGGRGRQLLTRRSAAGRAAWPEPSTAWRGSGGSPRSSQPPSGRRSISSRAISWPERRRDRRAAGADHAGERAVREPQADEHAAGHDAAPALGQAPQQRQQPVVDARQVRDRLHDHEPLGAARGALHQRGEDLRPLRGAHGERLVDDRQPRVRQRGPLDGARQQDLGVAVVPARRRSPGPSSSAHGWSPTVASRTSRPSSTSRPIGWLPWFRRAPGRPRAARRVDRADEEPLADLADTPRVEPPREIRVRFEELYRAAGPPQACATRPSASRLRLRGSRRRPATVPT